jgi:hypothetical protein
MHIENLGGDITAPELQNKRLILGMLPVEVQGRRGCILPRSRVYGGVETVAAG